MLKFDTLLNAHKVHLNGDSSKNHRYSETDRPSHCVLFLPARVMFSFFSLPLHSYIKAFHIYAPCIRFKGWENRRKRCVCVFNLTAIQLKSIISYGSPQFAGLVLGIRSTRCNNIVLLFSI